jgi:hypothetical protein
MGQKKAKEKTARQLKREEERSIVKSIRRNAIINKTKENIKKEAIQNIRQDLEKELERVRAEQLKFDAEFLVAGVLIALHNQEGWGKKRLTRIAMRISKEFELAQDEKIVSLKDMRDYLLDNFDIDLTGDAKVKGK